MNKMRNRLRGGMALAVAFALVVGLAGIAGAEKPVTVRAGNLDLTFNGGFAPKALSKTKPTPIGLDVSGKIKTVDGSHPPALSEFILETDKNGAVNVKGLPTCTSAQLQSQETKNVEAICKDAIVGHGTTQVEVAFAEQAPISVSSKLLVLSGGVRGGVTTFYIHAYFTAPITGAIVTTVKIKKIHKGRFGTEAISTIPTIAGGSGSVKSFSLKIDRKFTYKGKKVSVLTLKCPDGKVQARGEAVFKDGTKAKAEVIRACTPKG